jgi:trehalose 6-phosphate synthase/trehalose 6-phosphate phosphatase
VQILKSGVEIEPFFERLSSAPSHLLMLDYDGTLAPFSEQRDQAFPYPDMKPLLAQIHLLSRTRLVLISGRAIQDLRRLLALDPMPELYGSHGWEHLSPQGIYTLEKPDESILSRLENATAFVHQQGMATYCEQKPLSVALHWRGLADSKIPSLQRIKKYWQQLSEQGSLELLRFDEGVELRVRGKHKGTAVAQILSGYAETPHLAYLGDDYTDEEAFEVIGSRGLKILVRNEFRPTKADLWLQPPNEVVEFLSHWFRNSWVLP